MFHRFHLPQSCNYNFHLRKHKTRHVANAFVCSCAKSFCVARVSSSQALLYLHVADSSFSFCTCPVSRRPLKPPRAVNGVHSKRDLFRAWQTNKQDQTFPSTDGPYINSNKAFGPAGGEQLIICVGRLLFVHLVVVRVEAYCSTLSPVVPLTHDRLTPLTFKRIVNAMRAGTASSGWMDGSFAIIRKSSTSTITQLVQEPRQKPRESFAKPERTLGNSIFHSQADVRYGGVRKWMTLSSCQSLWSPSLLFHQCLPLPWQPGPAPGETIEILPFMCRMLLFSTHKLTEAVPVCLSRMRLGFCHASTSSCQRWIPPVPFKWTGGQK